MCLQQFNLSIVFGLPYFFFSLQIDSENILPVIFVFPRVIIVTHEYWGVGAGGQST